MHKFLRSIGFSTYRKKRDIEKLLASLIPSAKWHRIQLDEETNLCELRAEVAPGMGMRWTKKVPFSANITILI